jgi:hypothetical protein
LLTRDAPRPVENVPATHEVQTVDAFIPAPVEYRPAPHRMHTDAAVATAVIE